ncbi:unnamed protein product [Prorocentrum cordatum]|uniref:Retrovirus-related Pol polyprotein from transposon TNT 1-94 n=1 Tax=Prorocentrum cordatum TaxID=2364126 RepID=A0ABN9U093_9DINO|nr:unnamed protein product [Polarella glacialis]
MQRMMAAFEGLGTRSTSTTTTSERPCLVDTKGIGKPQPLRGDNWPSFCFKYMNFISSMYPTARDLHEWAQSHEDTIRVIEEAKQIDPDAERIQNQLYTVLAQLVEGESEEIVRNCESHKYRGFESWRRLVRRWDPMNLGRKRSILMRVLNQPEQKLENLSSAIEAWTQDITRYQQRAKKTIDDDIKTAVLISMCPNPLKQHLQLNQNRFDFYDDVVEEVTQYLETRRAGQLDKPVPMDIGSLQKGAGKGKSKGKGKDAGKASGGKGKQPFQGYCNKCWEWGHMGKDCTSGKGRDADIKPCGVCGKKGHASKDCWHANTGKASKGAPKGSKGGKTKKGGKKGLHGMETSGDYEDQPEPEVGGLELCAVERAAQGTGLFDDIFRTALESLDSAFSGVGDSAPEPPAVCAGRPADVPEPTEKRAPVKEEGLEVLGLYSPKYDQEYEVIEAAVDSGAGVTIMPEEMCSDHPIDPDGSGIEYNAAGGQTVTDKGQRKLQVVTETWQQRSMKSRVGPVRRMLLAASDLVDHGTGTPLNRANGIFLMKLWEKKNSAPKQQGAEAATNPMEIDQMIAALQKLISTGGTEVPTGSVVESKVAESMGFFRQVPVEEEFSCKICTPMRSPCDPTPKEVEEHEASQHLPFRSWCPDCVKGRGAATAHADLAAELEHETPTISTDYFFLGGSDQQALACLAKVDHKTRLKTARVVPQKGSHEAVIKQEARDIKNWGRTKFIYKSDQESPITAMKDGVIAQLGTDFEVIPEPSKVGESPSNGTIERAIQAISGMVRTLKVATERAFKITLDPRSNILHWLVQFAGFSLSRYEQGADGRTPYERAKGKRFKLGLPTFGEKVFYRRLRSDSGRLNKLDPKWLEGVFLGCRDDVPEFFIGTKDGVGRSADIRRLPPSSRYDAEALLAVKGTPLDPVPGDTAATLPASSGLVVIDVPEPSMVPPDPPRHEPEVLSKKRVYITKQDLKRHGWTRGCPRCEADMSGQKTTLHHTEGCRRRLEEAIGRTDQGKKRLREADERITEALADHVRRQVEAQQPEQGAGSSAPASKAPRAGRVAGRTAPAAAAGPVAGSAGSSAPASGAQPADADMPQPSLPMAVDAGSTAPASVLGGDAMPMEDTRPKRKAETSAEVDFLSTALRELGALEAPDCTARQTTSEWLGCTGGRVFDIRRVDPDDGSSWDCSLPAKQRKEILRQDRVYLGRAKGVCWLSNGKELAGRMASLLPGQPADTAVVQGLEAQLRADGRIKPLFACPLEPEEDLHEYPSMGDWCDHSTEQYVDDVSGCVLDPTFVKGAREAELREVDDFKVYKWAPVEEAVQVTGKKPIGVRWSDTNKGNHNNPNYRSRLCAKELKVKDPGKEGTFAATPPLEALRFLCSLMMTAPGGEDAEAQQRGDTLLLFMDATRAHFHRPTDELIYVEVEEQIRQHIKMKKTGLLGPGPHDDKEVRCLNRIIRLDTARDCLEWECDPRHAQITVEQMGLRKDSKGVVTPGVSTAVPDPKDDPVLDRSAATLFRAVTMRTAYQSIDRPELLYPAKEAARAMQNPTRSALEKIKRIARYLVSAPRVVQVFHRQPEQSKLIQYTDTDHAGCKVTRRSTSAGTTMHGSHMLAAYSTTQKPIATSSGESEYYGMFKAGSRLVGMALMAKDYGLTYKAELRADASAGIGIASRRGIGKIRHLHTQALWLQQAVADKRLSVVKTKGESNPANLPTKHVDGKTMWQHLADLGFELRSGQSKLAIEVARDA